MYSKYVTHYVSNKTIFAFPNKKAWPIRSYTNSELKRIYTIVLSDADGAGVHEPVAEAVRTEWLRRRLNKWDLISIERQFTNMKKSNNVHDKTKRR